jgi:hypothetical protein
MSESLRVPVDRLRAVFELLVKHIAEDEGQTIELKRDYFFWAIPPDDLYNPYEKPEELTMGQLASSWEKLEEILKDDEFMMTYHFVWLADILRALGHHQTREEPAN